MGSLVAAVVALSSLALSASPLQREQPEVRAGNERLLAGDPAGAIERYAAAERAVGSRPEIELDRGTALARQGAAGRRPGCSRRPRS